MIIETDKLEFHDNIPHFKPIRIEEFNKKKEVKNEMEGGKMEENIETNSNLLSKIENDKTNIVHNYMNDESNDINNENEDNSKDENGDKNNEDKYEEGKKEQCHNAEHNLIHKTHRRNGMNNSTKNENIYISKHQHTDEEFEQCERRSTEKKRINKIVRRSKNDVKVSVEEEEDDNYYEIDEKENSNRNDYRSKNEHDIKARRRRKGRNKGEERIRRKEGAIMEWSAIGSLNWDIMFLLGGGFALSEGFQVSEGRVVK